MTVETLTTVFGWMTVLNIGFLTVTTVLLLAMQDWVTAVHARMFKMEEADLHRAYFDYLAKYKILTVVFALTPYIALKLAQ